MSARRLMAAFAVVAAVVGISASSVLGAQRQAQKTTVKVTAFDLGFRLSTKRAPHGVVTFTVKNTGAVTHDFAIAGKKTKRLSHNQSTTLTVTLKKGKYPYKCTVDGHAAAGMRGTFTAT
jgi:plastocyanin